jgi:hypothetical protein
MESDHDRWEWSHFHQMTCPHYSSTLANGLKQSVLKDTSVSNCKMPHNPYVFTKILPIAGKQLTPKSESLNSLWPPVNTPKIIHQNIKLILAAQNTYTGRQTNVERTNLKFPLLCFENNLTFISFYGILPIDGSQKYTLAPLTSHLLSSVNNISLQTSIRFQAMARRSWSITWSLLAERKPIVQHELVIFRYTVQKRTSLCNSKWLYISERFFTLKFLTVDECELLQTKNGFEGWMKQPWQQEETFHFQTGHPDCFQGDTWYYWFGTLDQKPTDLWLIVIKYPGT